MADYTQTHVVPKEGLAAWPGPDSSAPPAATLDPGLDVMVIESRGGWAHIRCSNGWEAWVDARRLIASPPPATAAPPPPPTMAPPPTPQPVPPPPTQTAPVQPPSQPPPPPGADHPSAAWAAPAGAPGPPAAAGVLSLGPGQIIGLVGSLLFLVSSWLPWIRQEFTGGEVSISETYSAYRIPGHFLLDSQSELGGLSFGIVIAFFGVVCIAAALLSGLHRSSSFLSLVAGGAALLVVVLFLVQTRYLSNQLPGFVASGYFSLLRFGAYVALLGAVLSVAGGVAALAQKR